MTKTAFASSRNQPDPKAVLGKAVVRARVFPNGPYFAMLDGDDQIRGEVARLRSPTETLSRLYEYEGPEYIRVERPALLDSGEQITVWVYHYREGSSGGPISSIP